MQTLLRNNITLATVAMMDRSSGPGKHSYWGQVDHCVKIAPGFFIVMTPGHGGAWLHSALLNEMPDTWQSTPYSPGPWFEEDADIFLPLFWFQDYILKYGLDKHTIQCIEADNYFKQGKNCCYHGAAYQDYMSRVERQEGTARQGWPVKTAEKVYAGTNIYLK